MLRSVVTHNLPHFALVNLKFLLYYIHFTKEASEISTAVNMLKVTLRKMADGGVHDHIFGGFHRYSVDKKWHVPHFEKMLYDQAQLAEVYALFHAVNHEQLDASTVRDILAYVEERLLSTVGGFFSSEDAESPLEPGAENQEGTFYCWKYHEVVELLAEKIGECAVSIADVFLHHYSITADGNIPSNLDPHGYLGGKNILICLTDIEQTAKLFGLPVSVASDALEKGRQILKASRKTFPRPSLDTKIITAWNGLMISGYAVAARLLNDPSYLETALKTAEFLLHHCYSETSLELQRLCYVDDTCKIIESSQNTNGFAEDYVSVIAAFLDLYESSYDDRWISLANRLQDKMDALFYDPDSGSYFINRAVNDSCMLRVQDENDGATPSVNSLAALNLARLYNILGNEALRSKLERLLKFFGAEMSTTPFAVPLMTCALMLFLKPAKQVCTVT
ncbi:unnamed protein product [Soboliphyme baturini]|uniref:Thioredox_DsbH domain-containing protein n=1 Tax=Soboliphyme baturini TaxID=241478 RepID=A0A183J6H2_9BILA|nr:unnamed protein product [Soboliphyme baturini]